jgi:hypothetical protein
VRSDHPTRPETLAQYYVRTCGHLIPPHVSIVEYDERTGHARDVTSSRE